MSKYNELKTKWQVLLQQQRAGYNFDYDLLSKGKFCIHISDSGDESMSSYSSIELTGLFDSPIDALAYLRFAEIPRILDFDTVTDTQLVPEVADAYILRCEPREGAHVDHLLGFLDRAIIAGSASATDLASIRKEFNAAFSSTNPEVQILAWG